MLVNQPSDQTMPTDWPDKWPDAKRKRLFADQAFVLRLFLIGTQDY
jgi:hypothetical protein